MKRKIKYIVIIGMFLLPKLVAGEYSKQLQQAILLYQEGKNTDAMDRFMDILVTGSPEEKAIASEYISKITQGIPPDQKKQKSDTNLIVVSKQIKDTKDKNDKSDESISETTDADLVSTKVRDKIKEIRDNILLSLYKKDFIKLYMDTNNEKPNIILLKEDKIFNEDMTFKTNIIEDLKNIAGLLDTLGRVTITIIPNGAISGNMKIANVRKATTIHSYFLSHGLSPTKVRLDMVGSYSQSSLSKKLDDFNGIVLAIDYNKEPEVVVPDSQLPQAYIAVYPDKIDASKNEACVVDFAVLTGKNPIASWKLILSRKTKTSSYAVQKIEDTSPIHSQIVFNGREKFVGSLYEAGEYEFSLEVADTKGNSANARKTIYLSYTQAQSPTSDLEKTKASPTTLATKAVSTSKTTMTLKDKKSSNLKNKQQKIQKLFCKVYFKPNTFEITNLSMEGLEKFVSDVKNFPKSKLIITGYAYSKEPKPKTVAYRRAKVVKNLLVKKYKIKSTRVNMLTKVVNFKKGIVEITVK
ncbi:MAG: OmpA family protein [Elusimicrobiales bacterium]